MSNGSFKEKGGVMIVKIMKEAGYEEALLGMSLSYNKESLSLEKKHIIASRLAPRDGGHNKFLESMAVWIDIDAPRYWWQEFDTYRVGVTKQSESTMHTIMDKTLEQSDFEGGIDYKILNNLNMHINVARNFDIPRVKKECFKYLVLNKPESLLQRRIVCTNYKSIANMIAQRKHHKLPEWSIFIDAMKKLERFEFIKHSLERRLER